MVHSLCISYVYLCPVRLKALDTCWTYICVVHVRNECTSNMWSRVNDALCPPMRTSKTQLGAGAVQRGTRGAQPPVKILPPSCGPPIKFMIKHIPLVRGGSLWHYRSVYPAAIMATPLAPKCKPQNRHRLGGRCWHGYCGDIGKTLSYSAPLNNDHFVIRADHIFPIYCV